MRAPARLVLLALVLVLTASAQAQWRNSVSRDEMTGKKQAYATSPMASPTRRMAFPYSDVQGWIGFGCDGTNEWAYVGFSNQPNLTNTEAQEGYSSFTTRVKWDDLVESTPFTQKWGDSFIHFTEGQKAIGNITNSGTMLLELEWYGSSTVYFRFSLRGASAAIERARAACK